MLTLFLMWPEAPRRISFLAILLRPSATAMWSGASPFCKEKPVQSLIREPRYNAKEKQAIIGYPTVIRLLHFSANRDNMQKGFFSLK